MSALIRRLGPARSASVASWGRAGKDLGVTVGGTVPVLQRVCVDGDELQQTLDAALCSPTSGILSSALGSGVDDELRGLKMTVQPLGDPNDATGFKVERGPRTFPAQRGVTDEQGGSDGAVWLFLLEGGAEAMAAGVTTQAEGARGVDDDVVFGENQDRRGGELTENVADGGFHWRGEREFAPLLEKRRDFT